MHLFDSDAFQQIPGQMALTTDPAKPSRTFRTLADVRRAFEPGQLVEVTNHYIDRPDHPFYGTRQETVLRVNSSRLVFTADGSGIDWPKASQVVFNEDGSVTFNGGGCSQAPDDAFVTLRWL